MTRCTVPQYYCKIHIKNNQVRAVDVRSYFDRFKKHNLNFKIRSIQNNVKSSNQKRNKYNIILTFITYYYCLSEILIFYYRDVQY